MASNFSRVAIAGDTFGINQLLKNLPQDLVKCIIAASIRPQYINELRVTADSINVPLLLQPVYYSSGYPDFTESFRNLDIDLLVSNSYSMFIRADILQYIQYNAVNVHWALLPKNRGPNPVQWSIIHGDEYTGVTIHYLDEGTDTGDIIAQEIVKIEFTDTWFTLREKLFIASDKLLEDKLPLILSGRNHRIKQNEAEATQNPRLNSDSPRIDPDAMSDIAIYNLIRAQVAPLKGAYLEVMGRKKYFDNFINYDEIPRIRDLDV